MSSDGTPLNDPGRHDPGEDNPSDNDAEHAPETAPQESGGFVSYEDIASELGPFEPPADFSHGPEFEPPVPRPIPKRLKNGSYMSRRRATVRTLFVLGIGCIVFAPMPFVESISYYILPLAYLDWVGAALILFGVIAFVRNLVSSGLFSYVTTGEPIIGRILTPAVQDAGNAEMPMFRLAAGVEYRHPENNALMFATCVTEDQWGTADAEKLTQDFEAGDYVTLVAQPESVESTLKLYGYLGLDPDREYILKNGRPLKGVSPGTAVLIALAVLAILGIILMGIHVAIFSIPSGGAIWKFLAAAGIGLITALCLWFMVRLRKSSSADETSFADKELTVPDPDASSAQTVGPILAGFLGMIAGLFGLCMLNAAFDSSQPDYEAIEVVNFWETTHNGIFRTYEIEYRTEAGDISKYHATIEDINRLAGSGDDRLAVLDHGQGAFGLPWTRGTYPLVWVDAGDVEGSSVEVTVRMKVEGGHLDVRLTPVIEVRESEYDVPDAALARRALARLPQELGPDLQIIPGP